MPRATEIDIFMPCCLQREMRSERVWSLESDCCCQPLALTAADADASSLADAPAATVMGVCATGANARPFASPDALPPWPAELAIPARLLHDAEPRERLIPEPMPNIPPPPPPPPPPGRGALAPSAAHVSSSSSILAAAALPAPMLFALGLRYERSERRVITSAITGIDATGWRRGGATGVGRRDGSTRASHGESITSSSVARSATDGVSMA
mmetsp:Transcript_1418/g.4663  ORF Transcript_1418/g.4663 Transcript_1418/m.4663 type:complete len:212 (-) Transcript_1418:796-1431(-)